MHDVASTLVLGLVGIVL